MSDVRVVVGYARERAERVVTAGTTAAALFGDDRSVVAVRVNGQLKDLAQVVADGDVVEPVAIDSEDGRAIVRHSCVHVMAQAVQELFPGGRLGIGPPVEDGFYYDFDIEGSFHPDDLKRVEKRMQEIIKAGQRFCRRVVSEEEARAELAAEPYKLELIDLKGGPAADDEAGVEVGAGELTIYDNIDVKTGELCWKDLCRGPHVPTTRYIPAFKLMRLAAAYWRGSEKNPQLQRIYGTEWESRDALKDYLHRLEEAEKRDHRRLGAALDLFSFPAELGSGLAVFHPKGGGHPPGDGGLLAGAARRGWVLVRQHAAHHQVEPVRDLGPPEVVRRRHVPTHPHGGRGLLPEADELPHAYPDLQVAGQVVSGAAASAVRVRHGVPV